MYNRNHNFDDKKTFNNSRDTNGGSNFTHPLVTAAMRGDLKGVEKAILENNFSNDDYVSAISRAGGHGELSVLKLLTSLKINRPEDNERALRWSARHAKFECLQYFIEELNVPASCFNSASLRMAAQYGHMRELKYLHEKGADIQANDNEAIKSAIRFYHDDIAEYLIEHGADFSLYERDFEDNARKNAVYISSTRTGDLEVDRWDLFYRVVTKVEMKKTLRAMLSVGVSRVALDNASIKVASYGQVEDYKLLRRCGADVNAQNVAALSEAARFGHDRMVVYLLNNEPELDRAVGLQRALKKSMEASHESVSLKIMRHINNEMGSIGNQASMLDRFLRFKQMNCAEELINQNTWLIYTDTTIQANIVKYGSVGLLQSCIASGMPIKETEGLVDAALEQFNFDNARVLLEEGVMPADLNTCLVNAAQFGKLDIVIFMLESGARADYHNNKALTVAVEFDHVNVVKFLRAYGAIVDNATLSLCKSDGMRAVLNLSDNKIKGEVNILSLKDKVVGA